MYFVDIAGIHLEDPQPHIPPPVSNIDYSHEASEYEKKLIQVIILFIVREHKCPCSGTYRYYDDISIDIPLGEM